MNTVIPPVRCTTSRAEVERIYDWSLEQVALGFVQEHKNFEPASHWHNSKFTHTTSRLEWVVYLPDQAWSGEVRLIAAASRYDEDQ